MIPQIIIYSIILSPILAFPSLDVGDSSWVACSLEVFCLLLIGSLASHTESVLSLPCTRKTQKEHSL